MKLTTLLAPDLKEAQREAREAISPNLDDYFLRRFSDVFPSVYQMTVDEIRDRMNDIMAFHDKVRAALLDRIESGHFPQMTKEALLPLLPESFQDPLAALRFATMHIYQTKDQFDDVIGINRDAQTVGLHPSKDGETIAELSEEMMDVLLGDGDQSNKVALAQILWSQTKELHENPDIAMRRAFQLYQAMPQLKAVIVAKVEEDLSNSQVPTVTANDVLKEAGMLHMLSDIKGEDGSAPAVDLLRKAFPIFIKQSMLFLNYHAGCNHQNDGPIEIHTPVSFEPTGLKDNSLAARVFRALEIQQTGREAKQMALTGGEFLHLLPPKVAKFLKQVEFTLRKRIEKSKLPIVNCPVYMAPSATTDWVKSDGLMEYYGQPLMLMDVAEIYFKKQHGIQANCSQDTDRHVITFTI